MSNIQNDNNGHIKWYQSNKYFYTEKPLEIQYFSIFLGLKIS